jgi:hypothetical protein
MAAVVAVAAVIITKAVYGPSELEEIMRAFLSRVLSSIFSPGWAAASLACLVILVGGAGHAAKRAQVVHRDFDSPESAVAALVDTLRKDDHAGLVSILGDERLTPRSQKEDRADVAAFLKSFDLNHAIDQSKPGVATLSVGEENWFFPVPITRQGDFWRFDTQAGMQEIFDRNIGRNELLTIETLKAYVAAQQEYATKSPEGKVPRQFACRFFSSVGKKNGLYWQAPAGQEESPIGPMVAKAAREECLAMGVQPVAFHGYFFKILTRQGKHAPGGSYEYMVGGEMVLGFACMAYPEAYGITGVMTFLINQDGTVYQKNLGKRTDFKARAIKEYNPDSTWTKVESVPAASAPATTQ